MTERSFLWKKKPSFKTASASPSQTTPSGSSWAEQDDAFFGGDDNSSHPAAFCRPCDSGSNSDGGSSIPPTTTSNNKQKIAELKGKMSSKLSDLSRKTKLSMNNIGQNDNRSTQTCTVRGSVPSAATTSNNSNNFDDSKNDSHPKSKKKMFSVSQFPGQRRPSSASQNGRFNNNNNNASGDTNNDSSQSSARSAARNTMDISDRRESSKKSMKVTEVRAKKSIGQHIKSGLISQVPLPCKHCGSLPLMMYKTHPYFGASNRICVSHDENAIKRCEGCNRFLSKNHTTNTGDPNHYLCTDCEKSAIWAQEQVDVLYSKTLKLLAEVYGFSLYQDRMQSIPINLAGNDKLNNLNTYGPHANDTDNSRKRGFCVWSEYNLMLGGLPVNKVFTNIFQKLKDKKAGSIGGGDNEINQSKVERSRDQTSKGSRNVKVHSIFVLRGLPANLTGSILAHEATHAWFAMNPLRRDCKDKKPNERGGGVLAGGPRRIPLQVEEGCCQLVAFLYLNHVLYDKKNNNGESKSSKAKNLLKDDTDEYFRWAIENDLSEVYGEGFRKAARAYEHECKNGRGLLTLLEHVCQHRDFPNIP